MSAIRLAGALDEDERAFQKAVIDLARTLGYKVAHFRPARTASGWRTPVAADGKGWPDLCIVGHGRLIFAELKVGGNKLTDEQEEWLERLTRNGELAFCWRPSDFDEIVETLKGKKGV